MDAMTQKNTLDKEMKNLLEEASHHHHHEHDEDCCEHEHHHHHEHDEEHCDHEHHREHDENCTCGCHDHEHHHHHADDVFTSWGAETPRPYTIEAVTAALESLSDESAFGMILRAKGIVAGENGKWIHFDYVPGVPDVRTGSAETIGRLCVIGSKINEEALKKLFCVE